MEGENAIKTRITRALGKNSHSLQMEVEATGEESVYSYISNFWNGNQTEDDFIDLSQKLTLALAKAQNSKKYTGGILVVMQGRISLENNRYICVIKADIQDGFNVETKNGVQALSYIRNLFLTDAQKLQKIGFFIDKSKKINCVNANEIEAYVYDSNTDRHITLGKAAYFYKDFLGLKISSNNDVLTNKFYQSTKEFINKNEKINTAKKYWLHTQLLNYINSYQYATVNSKTFADSFFGEGEINDMYRNFMVEHGIPAHDIIKDLTLVNVKNRKLKFENSISIQAPVDNFSKNIEITEDEQGNTIVQIRGKLLSE